jgi:trans-aconitate 2-methyltransferase
LQLEWTARLDWFMTAWDPEHYEQFFAERRRPGRDLIGRIDAAAPQRIVDLGCGTGHLTAELAERWPDASVTGIDRSAEMIAAAPATGVTYQLGDIETWASTEPVDVIFANASLHWIAGHERLFPHLVSMLAPTGTLAVQMPLSREQPSHQILRDVGSEFGVSIGAPPTLEPSDYYEVLAGRARTDVWVTTYSTARTLCSSGCPPPASSVFSTASTPTGMTSISPSVPAGWRMPIPQTSAGKQSSLSPGSSCSLGQPPSGAS